MGKPYSQDLRERVVAAVDGGTRVVAVAAVFRVSISYIYKVLIRRRLTGETTTRTGRAGRKSNLLPTPPPCGPGPRPRFQTPVPNMVANAAKSLTWQRYLVAGRGFEPLIFRL